MLVAEYFAKSEVVLYVCEFHIKQFGVKYKSRWVRQRLLSWDGLKKHDFESRKHFYNYRHQGTIA